MRLIALRELGLYLLRTPRLKRGRPRQIPAGRIFLPSLPDLGVPDSHVASDAVRIARISQDLLNEYLEATDKPAVKGLFRFVNQECGPPQANDYGAPQ
jgi:hypothetical protein